MPEHGLLTLGSQLRDLIHSFFNFRSDLARLCNLFAKRGILGRALPATLGGFRNVSLVQSADARDLLIVHFELSR